MTATLAKKRGRTSKTAEIHNRRKLANSGKITRFFSNFPRAYEKAAKQHRFIRGFFKQLFSSIIKLQNGHCQEDIEKITEKLQNIEV